MHSLFLVENILVIIEDGFYNISLKKIFRISTILS